MSHCVHLRAVRLEPADPDWCPDCGAIRYQAPPDPSLGKPAWLRPVSARATARTEWVAISTRPVIDCESRDFLVTDGIHEEVWTFYADSYASWAPATSGTNLQTKELTHWMAIPALPSPERLAETEDGRG